MFVTLSSLAKLGESNVQIAARYGAVLSRTEIGTNEWMGLYTFKEYHIGVTYYTNTCVMEMVQPIEARRFSDTERDALMKNIGGAGDWVKDGSTVEIMADAWINTTTKAHARVESKIMGPDSLMIMSPVFIAHENEKKAAEDKKKAEGF